MTGNYDLSNTTCHQNKHQFTCLYTKHKTQKRKIWKDGRLVIHSTRAVLHDANPAPGSSDPSLDECEVSSAERQALLQQKEARLETDKFLIQIEGEWKEQTSSIQTTALLSARSSSSMQKLLNRKFQKPKAYIPPNPGTQSGRLHENLGKRKRPLQPGELQKMYYVGNQQTRPQAPQRTPQDDYRNPSRQPRDRGAPLSTNPSMPRPFSQSSRPPPAQFQNRASPSSQQNIPSQAPDSFVPPFQENRPTNVSASDAFVVQQPMAESTIPPQAPDSFVLQPPSQDNRLANLSGPDAFVVQQPMAESSKPGALEFVSNEFNATSFYGLDDEEEEEQQQQQPPESQEPQLPQNNGKSTIRKDDYSSPHGIETNENDAVSGNQLLALFGAAPPTKHAAVPDTNGDSQDPFLVFATADSDQPKNSSSKDAGHSTSLDEHQHSRVAFTLPPASQSSSSSEEEDAFSQEG